MSHCADVSLCMMLSKPMVLQYSQYEYSGFAGRVIRGLYTCVASFYNQFYIIPTIK